MKTKKWYESKTMWLNIAAGLLAVLLLVDKTLLSAFGLSEDTQTKVLKIFGSIVAIINVVLRIGVQSPVSSLPSGTVVANDVKAEIAEIKADIKK